MELSPKLLTEIEFREQWRGYSPSEVDEFLERVAAGVGELQQRLSEALERASAAERKLLERTDEDEIRRTLVLAQRTAVQAMEEARADADRLVGEADAQCRELVAAAQARAAELDAELDARRREELATLAEQRAALEDDISRLESYVEEQRAQLRAALQDQLDRLDRGLALAPRPEVSVARVAPPAPEPEAAQAMADSTVTELAGSGPPASEPATDGSGGSAPDALDELRAAREELEGALTRAGVAPSPPEPGPEPAPRAPRPLLFDAHAGDDTGSYDAVTAQEADEEPVTPPHWRDETGDDDDPFLAELRRAVVDTEPLGPRDHDPASGGHSALPVDHDIASGGFFRRGRRRT